MDLHVTSSAVILAQINFTDCRIDGNFTLLTIGIVVLGAVLAYVLTKR